jgi:hypothetical protein
VDGDGIRRGRRGLGGFEDLVAHDDGDAANRSKRPLLVRKLWNPVTYRCAFCSESFLSKAMIRRHLERHNAARDDAVERAA